MHDFYPGVYPGILYYAVSQKKPQTTANIDDVDELVLSQEDEYAFLSQSVILYCEFVEHPPGSTPVRQQRRRLRSFALFLACHYQTHLLSI